MSQKNKKLKINLLYCLTIKLIGDVMPLIKLPLIDEWIMKCNINT